MANVKKEIIEKNENLETAKTDTKLNENIDIDKMIQEAIAKSVAETSKTYQEKINILEAKLKEKENIKENTKEENSITIKPDKMVWIQHMAPGGAGFHRGRVNITFDKLFDKRRIKWDILDEMFYEFHTWFDEFELVILDEEVRKYYGIENNFEENGADESKFIKLLSMKNNEMIDEISRFSFMVASSFLKFFIDEYIKGNVNCLKNNKFQDVQNYYKKRYNIDNLQELIAEMTM